MPNIANVLREEIQRLAKKQVKAGMAPLKRDNIRLKKTVADLRRQVAALSRASNELSGKIAPVVASRESEEAADTGPRLRPTSKSLESLRHRLGLTQVEFGQLLGVSGQAVVYWAGKKGPVRMRRSTLATLAQIQRIGKREARRRLEGKSEGAAPATSVRRGRRKK